MKWKVLSNILLDLPVQLSTPVRSAFMSLHIYVSHASAQWRLPSSASHCLRHIAGLHTLLRGEKVHGLCGHGSMEDDLHDVARHLCVLDQVCTLARRTRGDFVISIELRWLWLGVIVFYTLCRRTGQTSLYAEARNDSSTVAYLGGLPISAKHETSTTTITTCH